MTACDSAGAVGPKPGDVVATTGHVVGRFTARVALMEVLAVGAAPVAASAACCVDPETAEALLAGVRAELGDLPLVVSTEKNLPTVQTGLGVTVVGTLPGPWPTARRGDGLYLVGVPKVGAAVRVDDPDIADVRLLRQLQPLVHALIPVGSRGAWHEARVLADEAGLTPEAVGDPPTASAGPATALVVAAPAPPQVSVAVRLLGYLR